MIAESPSLFDYLALLWRRRWFVLALSLVAVAGVATHPATYRTAYEARAVFALTPEAFAQRAQLLIAWRALPDGVLPAGVVEVIQQQGIMQIAVMASSAASALAGVEAIAAWLESERRPSTESFGASARPSGPQVEAWRRALTVLEQRLAVMPPSEMVYWTARALELHAKIESARGAIPVASAETFAIRRRWPATVIPNPWLKTLGVAALSGLGVGVVLAFVLEWWSRALAARRREGRRRHLITPIVDTGVGDLTHNIATDFSGDSSPSRSRAGQTAIQGGWVP